MKELYGYIDEKPGFKAYKLEYGDLIDRYGNKYETRVNYNVDENVKFHQSGFHFCSNPEDTLRYVDSFNDKIAICEVIGSGNYNRYDDDYAEYYGMYATSNIKIERIIPRKELIDYVLKNSYNIERFIYGFNLSFHEIYYILENSNDKNKYEIRKALIKHVIDHKFNIFDSFINRINITDGEIITVLQSLEYSNLTEDQINDVRSSLGKALQKEKVRVRK